MGRSLLARSRALAGCAFAGLAAGLAGCAAGSPAPTVSGKTLAVYVSAPASLSADPQGQDVVCAEKLAFQQLQGQVTAYRLRLFPLSNNRMSENARTAISDTTHAIAYLGEVRPGDSADSIGITNAQDLLQVSPTDTAAELTQKVPAIPNSPTKYYESLGTYSRTFARVVPATTVEATALLAEMQLRGVRSVYVTGDASEYGRTVADELRSAATGAVKASASPTTADAVFFGGSDQGAATRTFNQAVATNPKVKLFAPSALNDDAFVASLSPPARRSLYVSAPGLLPHQLAISAGSFVSGFRSACGHQPSAEAIYGYEAMSAVLAVLHEAGSSANNRSTVVHDFFAIKNRSSPLGAYSINANGDTSLGATAFVIEHVKGSNLVPFQQG